MFFFKRFTEKPFFPVQKANYAILQQNNIHVQARSKTSVLSRFHSFNKTKYTYYITLSVLANERTAVINNIK